MPDHSLIPPPIALLRPPRLVFGVGATEACTAYLSERGYERVLLLKSVHLSGLEAHIEAWRGAVGELLIDDSVPPEPGVADCEAVLGALGGRPVDAVIGLGGGSVLDVAKIIAAVSGHGGGVRDLLGATPRPRKAGLICLPTTSGTGSEVSPNAILYDEEAKAKRAAIGPAIVPDAAFIDPALTVTLPPPVTAATGIDALSHCIEAYTNRRAHAVIDLYALEGIRLVAGALERAVRDGTDLSARSDMALGSLYGGYCLGPVNTAAVHALSYPLGSRFRLPHGLSNALLLPHVMRFNIPANPERHAIMARALGAADHGDPAATAEAGVQRVEALSRRCGLPSGIASCGVGPADIPSLATAALEVRRLLDNNPRPVSQADAEAIYHTAL